MRCGNGVKVDGRRKQIDRDNLSEGGTQLGLRFRNPRARKEAGKMGPRRGKIDKRKEQK